MKIADPDTESAVRKFIARIPADLPVERALLYGSRARGDFRPDSDADVAVILRHGADDWKLLFLDALKRELRMVPNLDGTGFINLGRSSSDLSKGEMSDLMTLIEEFGARHGVKFGDVEESE